MKYQTSRNDLQYSFSNVAHSGFTLVELMVVIVLVAIIASVAIPSYKKFIIRNSEHQVQAQMERISLQLERWSASRLTYKGFVPRRTEGVCAGQKMHCYDDTDNKIIYIPEGSNATNYKYKLELVDSTDVTKSLFINNEVTINSAIGRSWKMLATPNPNMMEKDGHDFMLTAVGLRCMVLDKNDVVVINSKDCGSHYSVKAW